ncbi:hypothetical protein ACOIC7_30555, partial [Klebsiella pneumoniae]|uniref:hypothetical protein n=1 Tax=Klebsiella pneumoniae TaxID=573 RepID=UPI003B5BD976
CDCSIDEHGAFTRRTPSNMQDLRCSQKITARKSTSRPELVRQSLAWTCFVETPHAEPVPVVPQEDGASGVGSTEDELL